MRWHEHLRLAFGLGLKPEVPVYFKTADFAHAVAHVLPRNKKEPSLQEISRGWEIVGALIALAPATTEDYPKNDYYQGKPELGIELRNFGWLVKNKPFANNIVQREENTWAEIMKAHPKIMQAAALYREPLKGYEGNNIEAFFPKLEKLPYSNAHCAEILEAFANKLESMDRKKRKTPEEIAARDTLSLVREPGLQ